MLIILIELPSQQREGAAEWHLPLTSQERGADPALGLGLTPGVPSFPLKVGDVDQCWNLLS